MADIMLRTVPRTNLRSLALLLLPALLVWMAWWPCLSGGFIRDDELYLVENPAVVSPMALAEHLLAPFPPRAENGLYRPLTSLSLRNDQCLAAAFGRELPDPWVPHVVNLILGSLSALLLGLLARAWGSSHGLAALAASFFAVAAVRAESLCWISGRAECLMVVTALATLLATARVQGLLLTGLVAGVGTLFTIGAKEQGFVLPLLIAFLPASSKQRLVRVVAAGVAAALMASLRVHVLGTFGPEGLQCVLREHGFLQRAIFALQWLGDYGRLVFAPWPLCHDYDVPAVETAWPALFTGLAVLAVLLWFTRADAARRFSALLFLLPLVPVLNLFTRTGETFAERFLALPLAGAALLLVPRSGAKRWMLVLPWVLIVLNVPLALRQAAAWQSEEALLQSMKSQGATAASLARREAYIERALSVESPLGSVEHTMHLTAAATLFARAHALNPTDRETALDLAKLQRQRAGDVSTAAHLALLAEAETLVREVLRAEPDHAHAHAVLGEILARSHRPAEALAAFGRSLDLEPANIQSLDWWLSLVPVEVRYGAEREARRTTTRSAIEDRLGERPYDPWLRMAAAHLHAGTDPARAVQHAHAALALARSPLDQVAMTLALSSILNAQGRAAEAAEVCARTRAVLTAEDEQQGARSRSQRFEALQQLAWAAGQRSEALHWLDQRIALTKSAPARRRLEDQRKALSEAP
jgi:tetratricopeptide (TPR) repeat protein